MNPEISLKAIRKRLILVDVALQNCHMATEERMSVLFENALNLWQWFAMYDRVSYSCQEWFETQYGKL